MKTLFELYINSINKYSSNILFKNKNIKYGSFDKFVNKNKSILKDFGIKPIDNVVFIGDNSEKWAGMKFASYQIGNKFIPIYKSQHLDTIKFIIKNTEPKLIICPNSQYKIMFEKNISAKHNILDIDSIDFNTINEYVPVDWTPKPEDSNIILFTSGTSGLSKGVVLTHKNLCSNIESIDKLIGENFVSERDLFVNFLPWSHIYGLNCELIYGFSKGSGFYINNNIANLTKDFVQQNPTIICTVPKLLHSIYEKINSSALSKILFNDYCIGYTKSYLKKKIFGSDLRFLNVGGAYISKELIDFYAKLDITIYQGYGLSETSPLISINCPKLNKSGSVGKILDCNHVKIIQDEIFVKGTNVFSSYYNNESETLQAFCPDGYFATGDTGTIDSDNYLWITGRKKDLYKLDNGKYINPIFIENILLESPLIKQIFVYGDNKAYNIALVVSDENINVITNEITKYSSKLKKYEIPQKILIVPAFTFEDKLLTPKMSMIRTNIFNKYSNDISNLYKK